MARYKVTINTEAYKCRPCSKKNWEHGTMNDLMIALNGWKTTETNLQQVEWRLKMFAGHGETEDLYKEYDSEIHRFLGKYGEWRYKKCNSIKYFDRLCGFEREQEITGYGLKQGYFDIDKVIKELRQNGIVRVPFEWLYDNRQYYKGMNGCYMEIVKCN